LVLGCSCSFTAALWCAECKTLRAPFFTEFNVLLLPDRLTPSQRIAHRLVPAALGCALAATAQADGQRSPRTPEPSAQVAQCLRSAAQKFQVDSSLLKAIARVESNFNPRAVNAANGNGTRDVGLMQINSTWLPTLRRWNITEQDLFNPCTNAEVGAWVLASNFSNMGPSWEAVGAYNARSLHKRRAYAWKVYRAYQENLQLPAPVGPRQNAYASAQSLTMPDAAPASAGAPQSSLLQVSDPFASVSGDMP